MENGLQAEGIVCMKILYIIGNDEMPFYSAETILPFRHIVEAQGITEESVCCLHADLEQLSTSMVDSSEIEIKGTVSLNLLVAGCHRELIIDRVEEQPLDMEKVRALPGITVYMTKPEDTLWEIAKKFYTTTEEICRMNELESEEISSGQPLLLVKKVGE